MIKVSIQKNSVETHGASFTLQADANSWIADGIQANWWGKPQRTLTANEQGMVVDIDGSIPNLSLAISQGAATDFAGNQVNTYVMPAEYSIAQSDISVQVNQQAVVNLGLNNQNFGATIIANIFALNEAKLQAGTLTISQLQTMMQDATISLIRELLWCGSIATAKTLISSYSGPYFTSDDKATILALLADY